MTAQELLRRMPELLDSEAARGIDATIQYDVSEPVHQVLHEGQLTTHDGPAESPDLTVVVGDDDLVRLFRGEINPMMAFMSGRVRVRGDMNLAQRLVGLIDRERLAEIAPSS